MDQMVRVAFNNYRATGKFPTAPKLYQSTVEVRELITNWIMARGTISPSDVFVQNYTLLPPVNTWLSTTTALPVNRTDYAGLVWTAFDGAWDSYLVFPSYENPMRTNLNREQAFLILGSTAMGDLQDIQADRSILKPYKDVNRLLGWAKDATAFLIQAGIFIPVNNEILPEQIVTNAEALAWVRKRATHCSPSSQPTIFHGQLETGKTGEQQTGRRCSLST